MLWGGRFSGETDELMRRFGDSFSFDRRLYAVDIEGSIAYAGAIQQTGLITELEHEQIVNGLEQVKAEFETDSFKAVSGDEDIHTAVERRLTELIGPVAGKLHTGRSRNDQVALDMRLWLLNAIEDVQHELATLQTAIIEQAENHLDLIMPGYTHLQPAQPILYSHWIMSYFWMLLRDQERLVDCAKRTAVSPLGAGALAGNPFDVDRHALAEALSLEVITPNSMDTVSDRDFVAEFLFCAAMIGVHISRFAEDLIIYASLGYRFITIGEAYTTGSSIMPQKRNPDSLELARGKSGRLIGSLMSLLTTLKGLPSTYNKDMQEDKEPLFDAVDTLLVTLPVLRGVVASLVPDADQMQTALEAGMLATDLAEYLVEQGIPFREAHHITGRLVALAEKKRVELVDLSLEEFQAEHAAFDKNVHAVFDYTRAVSRRSSAGGTAPQAVTQQIAQARQQLTSYLLNQ